MNVIYKHTDPNTRIVRYIGETCKTPKRRLQGHLAEAKGHRRNHRLNWLRSLDQPPIVEILEYVHLDDVVEREKYWIALFRDYGHNLVNGTDGGEMPPILRGEKNPNFQRVFSLQEREKMAQARRGKKQSPETVKKRIDPLRGRKLEREVIEKSANSLRGRKTSSASSRFFGVHISRSVAKGKVYTYWIAQVRLFGVTHYLGNFKEEVEAARAVDAFVRANDLSSKLLNFP